MNTIEKIEYNLGRFEKGLPLSIKWLFPNFSTRYFGFVKGSYTIVTANSGVGKTKFAKFITINSIIDFKQKNPETPIHLYWFALEESKEMFELSIVSNILYNKFNLQFSVMQLLSLDTSKLIRPVLEKVEEANKEKNEIMSWITVKEEISKPSEVAKFFDKEMNKYGKHSVDKDGNKVFTYDNPEQHIFGVFDHYTFLEVETRPGVDNETQNLQYFSKQVCSRLLKDYYKLCWVGIQQQSSETERVEWYKGEAIISKLEASLNGLGIAKNTQQDATSVIGLFRPNRYNKGDKDKLLIPKYEGYDVSILKDTLLSAIVLKDRYFGTEGAVLSMLFNGATNNFVEAPKVNTEELKSLYNQIKNNPQTQYK
jgi:replicative DNA helicase